MKAIIADNKPIQVKLEKGKEYAFCTCGRSSGQPFCDGSHAGTDFTPKMFKAQKSGEAYLCQCKYSADLPFCDGAYAQFTDATIGKEGPDIQANTSNIPVASARNGPQISDITLSEKSV